jgi:hypothetical protein
MARHTQLIAVVTAAGMMAGVTSRANADIIYSTTFSTSASFFCDPVYPVLFIPYKSGTCTSNGNSMAITSGGGQTLTITFVGVTNVPITATVGSQIVDIGVIQTTLSGPGTFFFREPSSPGWFPFQFDMQIGIQTSVPVTGGQFWFYSASPTTAVATYPFNFCGCPQDNNVVPSYDLVFGAFQAGPLTAGGSSRVTAVAGLLAPEPATIALTATGLFLVAGVAISKRRAA